MLRTGPNEGRMGWQSDREADPFTESCRTRWSDRSSGAAAGDLSRGDSRRGPVVRPVASAILYLHSDIAIAISIPPSRCGARYLKLRYAGPVRGLCVSVVRVHLHARLLERVHMPRIRLFGCGSGGPCRGHTCCARHRVRFEWLAVQTTIRDRGPLRGTSRSPGRRALLATVSVIEAYSYHMEVRHGPARFLVGVARSMASVRAVAVEPQRLKRSWKLMAASPHRLPCSISKCVLVLKCSSAYSP